MNNKESFNAAAQKIVDRMQNEEIAKGVNRDFEQDAKIEQNENDIKSIKKSTIDYENKIRDIKRQLSFETERIENIYADFEVESAKIADIYTELYNIKQYKISQEYTDGVQDRNTKSVKELAEKNKKINDEQTSSITLNKQNINTNFEYIESIDSRLKKNRRNDIVTRTLSILSLLGMIGLYIINFI